MGVSHWPRACGYPVRLLDLCRTKYSVNLLSRDSSGKTVPSFLFARQSDAGKPARVAAFRQVNQYDFAG